MSNDEDPVAQLLTAERIQAEWDALLKARAATRKEMHRLGWVLIAVGCTLVVGSPK